MKSAALTCCLILGCLSGGSAATGATNALSQDELSDGWILLFDGQSLYGWQADSQADWQVDDGAIRATSGEPGLLHTTTQFSDYVLRLQFRAPQATNSGVFLRTPARPTNPAEDCYELNIADAANPFPTGSLVARKKARAVNYRKDWRSLEVQAEAGQFVVKLDGAVVLDYTDPAPRPRGFIGLQWNQGRVEFRDVKLRPLGTKSLFNGKDLTGWKTDRKDKSDIRVTADGSMQILNGPGQVESQDEFADFVLQMEIFCNGEELNSGVFFRCIPGDFWMGYESQIHNGTVDGDPTRPSNGGTGGIFRQQEARRVLAKDFQWFFKTIVADGNHVAVWVNGVQVCDWIDPRPPHENPRKGKRLQAGTLILQGHDAHTDLSFRQIRIVRMPENK